MLTANMVLRDDWEDRELRRGYLASQLCRGRLTLVLGAGVSIPFGLPGWSDLVRALFARVGEPLPSIEHTAEDLAEYLRHRQFENDWPGFIRLVHDALYDGVNADLIRLRSHPMLSAIGALGMSSRRGSTSEVITFNFDNLLELFLRYHGFVSSSVYADAHWAGYADVTVYHPHGWVPFDLKEGSSPTLIFDQQSYARVIGQDGNPWRQLVLTVLRRHTCVFVGISGRDMNLDSILETCRAQHVSRQENKPFWGITFSDSNDEVSRIKWESRGVFQVHVSNYETDIPDFLFGICQAAAEITL